jgi:hypothetical protein
MENLKHVAKSINIAKTLYDNTINNKYVENQISNNDYNYNIYILDKLIIDNTIKNICIYLSIEIINYL